MFPLPFPKISYLCGFACLFVCDVLDKCKHTVCVSLSVFVSVFVSVSVSVSVSLSVSVSVSVCIHGDDGCSIIRVVKHRESVSNDANNYFKKD